MKFDSTMTHNSRRHSNIENCADPSLDIDLYVLVMRNLTRTDIIQLVWHPYCKQFG